MIYFLAYISSTSYPLQHVDFESILNKSKINNTKLGVTGILIHIDGTILQILEGEKVIVEQLFQVIKEDVRHRAIVRVLEGVSDQRMFSNWSMGFKNLSGAEFRNHPDFFNMEDSIHLKNINAESHPVRIFMKAFYKGDI